MERERGGRERLKVRGGGKRWGAALHPSIPLVSAGRMDGERGKGGGLGAERLDWVDPPRPGFLSRSGWIWRGIMENLEGVFNWKTDCLLAWSCSIPILIPYCIEVIAWKWWATVPLDQKRTMETTAATFTIFPDTWMSLVWCWDGVMLWRFHSLVVLLWFHPRFSCLSTLGDRTITVIHQGYCGGQVTASVQM